MKNFKRYFLLIIMPVFLTGAVIVSKKNIENEVLLSWNDTVVKKRIIDFVTETTTEGSDKFIPVSERIAVFDNDGTLWCEQPLYFEMQFSLESAEDIVKKQTALQKKSGMKMPASENKNSSEKNILEAFIISHTSVGLDLFDKMAKSWISTKIHPRFHKPYKELTYLPMVELLHYLQDHQFKTYIVSGGSSMFIRNFSREVYGIPEEQVIGTMFEAEYKEGTINLKPKLWLNDDKSGKPEAIYQIIGKKPVLAFGNSDGDYQMLEWISTNSLPHLSLILHHTDAKREYAYDNPSQIGELKQALADAPKKGWIVADMKKDFKKIFNFE
ncbi:phosphoserine phosphatase [Chryseobacterium sp. H1D6B]|uniref:HAD family hydrolase n=1 Tax=Chryseobacterium sp. H1D6B TaxID=2940588 RepID=UPI0015C6B5B2|nr:HAD family hydrolase [Chryseobacterium sp. H1D6B]MDH6253007.1 phosphoserine phosphatase [Chryseobacterium sp. H1D6B]